MTITYYISPSLSLKLFVVLKLMLILLDGNSCKKQKNSFYCYVNLDSKISKLRFFSSIILARYFIWARCCIAYL